MNIRCRNVEMIDEGQWIEHRCTLRGGQSAFGKSEQLVVTEHLVLHVDAMRVDCHKPLCIRGGRRPIKLVQGQIKTRSKRAYAMGIESERARKRGFRGRHEVLALRMVLGQVDGRARERGESFRKIRRTSSGFLEQNERALRAFFGPWPEVVLALQKVAISDGIHGARLAGFWSGGCGKKSVGECPRYCPRDLVLEHEHVREVAVVDGRPQMISACRIDQLCRYPKMRTALPHAAFEHRAHREQTRDSLDVLVPALECK